MPSLDDDQLNAYLARIGASRPTAPTLAALNAILGAQLSHIPFENVDVLLHRTIDIELDAVFDKLVTRRRGGYCFELNTLFAAALETLGFKVTPLAARVRWNIPEGVPTPQSHMLLRVDVEHRGYLADAGFGGPNPPCAMPLSEPGEALRSYRLVPPPPNAFGADGFHPLDLEARGAGDWITLYRFDLTPQPWVDFVPRNWFVCTHPDSFFRHTLAVARSENGARYTLANGRLTLREPDGSATHHTLETPREIVAALRERFALVLDPDTEAGLARWLEQAMQDPAR